MTQALLQMQGITKRFPGVVALNNVSLSVNAGEIVALVGENGAGKSTLMKTLGGIVQPDEGTLLFDGAPVTLRSVNDSLGLGIGFIHQELNVFPNLDVAANVYLGREPRKAKFFNISFLNLIDRAKIERDTARLLERLGVNVSPRTPLAELSIAQRQMVEIAKALSLNTRVLIMDEPTSSLTLAETTRLLAVVKELRAQGVSIIYISHRLGEVTELADRVVVLRDGANAGTLTRDELLAADGHDRMVQMMVGREMLNVHKTRNASAQPNYVTVNELRTPRYPAHAVSFNVGKGEVLGVAGLIGAGRTEIAQAIFGVEPALSGSVALNGETLKLTSAQAAMRHGICLIPEDRRGLGLIVDWSIQANTTLATLPNFATSGLLQFAKEHSAATEMAGKLRIKAPNVATKVAQLSGGNQQKVVLAKWLLQDIKLIIFDEPTRGIDVGAKGEIYELINQLAANGAAIMVISSDLEEILRISDRIAVMHEGRITGTLNREDANEAAIMHLAVGK